MADYPDWTRLFQLAGTEITIPINIETSDVTIPISIVAATATVDVNLAAQVANITFEFADQSVAVFDAAKWFAHEAAQFFVTGSDDVGDNSTAVLATRAVPGNRVSYIAGYGFGLIEAATPNAVHGYLYIDEAVIITSGSHRGSGFIFDTPLRATAGQVVGVWAGQWGSGGAFRYRGGFWGYDEVVE